MVLCLHSKQSGGQRTITFRTLLLKRSVKDTDSMGSSLRLQSQCLALESTGSFNLTLTLLKVQRYPKSDTAKVSRSCDVAIFIVCFRNAFLVFCNHSCIYMIWYINSNSVLFLLSISVWLVLMEL